MDYKTLLPILSVLLAGGALIVNPLINIQVKFAPDAATARREVILIFVRVAQLVSAVLSVIGLIQELSSTQPVTPAKVLMISSYVASFLLLYVSLLLGMVTKAMGRQMDLTGRILGVLERKRRPKSSGA